MRSLFPLVAILLICGNPTPAEDRGANPRQLMISVRLCEGDPLGSREAGTLKVLAEPKLITIENRPGSFVVGGHFAVPAGVGNVQYIPTGLRVETTAVILKDDKARLDVTLSFSEAQERTENHFQVQTQSTR